MRPRSDQEASVFTACRRSGPAYPVRPLGFGAGHKLALDAWHAWVEREAEASALLDEARAARRPKRAGSQPREVATAVAALRQRIGAVLIDAGRRVQGAPSANPVAADAAADGAAS